jgi:hypothetical protein
MSTGPCCTPATPPRENPPGQPAIRYRTGDWASLRAAMVAQLPAQTVPGGARPLSALTSRDPADPTIALLDAAACALDVLTFYQERHLNEGYLQTATERLSLVMIARALGYEPGPGVAASGYLAFTTSLVATGPVTVPAGTAAMALPEGSSPPPVFETTETIEARPEWNAIAPRRRQPLPDLVTGDTAVWVEGVDARARPGDGLLLTGSDRLADPGSERWDFRHVGAAQTDAAHGQTRLVFDRPLGDTWTAPPPQVNQVLIFRNRASVFGHNAADWKAQSDQTQITAWWRAGGSIAGLPAADDSGLTRLLRRSPPVSEWPRFELAAETAVISGHLDLDREYPGILPGSWVVLADAYHVEAYRVLRASQRSRVDFGITAKVTRLQLAGENLELFDRRATVVWCEPDVLVRVGAPDDAAVTGASIAVEGEHDDLQVRMISVYGPAPEDDAPRGEVVSVTSATADSSGITTLVVDPPLAYAYRRDKVVVNANLARATHGQTAPPEVLGSGRAAAAFQRFVLKGRPLTHVSSPTDARGIASALTVTVGGVQWRQVEALYGQPADARVYALRHASDGTTVVEFGDGQSGSRLPNGTENVVGSYRTGLGSAGEVASGRATLLARRPAGIDAVTNPAAFTGSADPEPPEALRINAPRTVLTLDRLVSIQDYEDFARSFAGVGKALAVGIWEGQRRLVHVTLASASGQPLAATDPLMLNLQLALAKYRDPVHQVVVDTFVARFFGVEASLLIDPAMTWDAVDAAARAALAATFSFAGRDFGQGVTPAEVVATLQAVPGVRAVDLDRIRRLDLPSAVAPPLALLEAQGARASGGRRQTSELLLVSPDPAQVRLAPMTP